MKDNKKDDQTTALRYISEVAGMITRMAGALVVILMMVPKFFYILVPGGILLVLR